MALTKSPQSAIAAYEKQLDQLLGKYPIMLKLERKVGVPKARLVAGAGLLIVGYGLLQLAASMLVAVLVFAYPAFLTMRAMDGGSKGEQTAMQAYWVVAALLQLVEVFSGGALAHVLPFYAVLKIALHLWLALPMTQGSLVVYETVLRPTFKSLVASPHFAAASERLGSVASKLSAEAPKAAAAVKEAAAETAAAASSTKED